jgi:C-terminal processing protease CtpA/Prc
VQRNRKFVDAGEYLQGYDIHPEGHSVALISRGKPFTMANWEGAVVQHGELEGVRYRRAAWLNDGKRLVAVSDAPGEEVLEVHHADGSAKPERLEDLDIGRLVNLVVSSKKDQVALTNEESGSDGDIFSHTFKLMGLGLLIGKRTWGGVIGISGRASLVDGGLTTQPEFSFWFKDVGWGVENYGTDPDIEVEFRPQDYVAGRDPQLERGLAEHPPEPPDFGERPRLPLPSLPDVEPEV